MNAYIVPCLIMIGMVAFFAVIICPGLLFCPLLWLIDKWDKYNARH